MFKRYIVMCDLGTEQETFTVKGALSWFPYCGKKAVIWDKRKCIVLFARECA